MNDRPRMSGVIQPRHVSDGSTAGMGGVRLPDGASFPEVRAGHRRMLRAMGVTLALFGLMALAITALLMWWR